MLFPSLIASVDMEDLLQVARECPPGDFVECGVYQGGSAHHLYHLALDQGRTLHLFDTFAGHPVVDESRDNVGAHWLGRYAEGGEWLARMREAMPTAVFHVGTFPDTLPADLANVAFVHSDMDLYWPTKAVCELFPPRMVPGGRIVFDDYPFRDCPGVKLAVDAAFGPPTEQSTRPGGRRCITIGAV